MGFLGSRQTPSAISYQSHPNGYLSCDAVSPRSPAKSQELTTSQVRDMWSGSKGDSDVPDVHGTQILKAPLDISNTRMIYKPQHSIGHKTYETRHASKYVDFTL